MTKVIAGLVVLGVGLLLLSVLPLPFGSRGTAGSAASAQAEEGRAFFLAKGCASCHGHAAMPGSCRIPVGPDLSGYEPNPEFVRRWLRDPRAVRPGTRMPRLDLSEDEIEALVAFLDGRAAR